MRLIDSREFAYWIALYQIDPWGDDWWQTSRVCAATNNAMGGRALPRDFWPGETPPQSADQIWMTFMGLGADLQARENEKRRRMGAKG